MTDKVKLCCPNCGNQQLYSEEDSTVLFPVYLTDDGDGGPDIEYGSDFGETVYNDEGTMFKDSIWCRSCGSEHKFEELLTPRHFAHVAQAQCHVDEDTDKGTDVRFRAVCWASESGFTCDFASPWQHADDYVEAAEEVNRRRPKESFMGPSQLAYEAAERLGKEHMETELAREVHAGSA